MKIKSGNTEYARYWHGSTAVIRPMLLLFNIKQIYIVLAVVFAILFIGFIYYIYKQSKKVAFITILASIMVNIFITPFCLEYFWTIAIMLVTSIVAIKNINKENSVLYYIFFIVGMLTCFFDFLSTETLTLTMPLLLVIVLRYEKGRRDSFKDNFKLVLFSIVTWGLGYVGMWLLKWILAAIVMNKSVLDIMKDKALIRFNGSIEDVSKVDMYIGALIKNIYTLFPINIVQRKWKFIPPVVIGIILIIYFVDRKKIKKNDIIKVVGIIILIPYIRYLVLANHSYKHYFFTFRAQMTSIVGLLYIILNLINKNKVKKIKDILNTEIKIGKKVSKKHIEKM